MSIVRGAHWSTIAIAASVLFAAPACGSLPLPAAGENLAQAVGTLPIVTPQPRNEALKSGLKVRYFSLNTYSTVEVLGAAMGRPGTPGDNIAAIDFPDLGPGAFVMGTRQPERVGAVIGGLIRFDVSGTYSLAMVINDVAQLNIGGALLIQKDWDGTPSRLGKPIAFAITEPGWYQLNVVYYQRAGTAALQLLWKRPGQAGDHVVVPKEAYAHVAE